MKILGLMYFISVSLLSSLTHGYSPCHKLFALMEKPKITVLDKGTWEVIEELSVADQAKLRLTLETFGQKRLEDNLISPVDDGEVNIQKLKIGEVEYTFMRYYSGDHESGGLFRGDSLMLMGGSSDGDLFLQRPEWLERDQVHSIFQREYKISELPEIGKAQLKNYFQRVGQLWPGLEIPANLMNESVTFEMLEIEGTRYVHFQIEAAGMTSGVVYLPNTLKMAGVSQDDNFAMFDNYWIGSPKDPLEDESLRKEVAYLISNSYFEGNFPRDVYEAVLESDSLSVHSREKIEGLDIDGQIIVEVDFSYGGDGHTEAYFAIKGKLKFSRDIRVEDGRVVADGWIFEDEKLDQLIHGQENRRQLYSRLEDLLSSEVEAGNGDGSFLTKIPTFLIPSTQKFLKSSSKSYYS